MINMVNEIQKERRRKAKVIIVPIILLVFVWFILSSNRPAYLMGQLIAYALIIIIVWYLIWGRKKHSIPSINTLK